MTSPRTILHFWFGDDPNQPRSVELFEALAAETEGPVGEAAANAAEFARKHAAVIERFGRFPHRNEAWGGRARRKSGSTWRRGGDSDPPSGPRPPVTRRLRHRVMP